MLTKRLMHLYNAMKYIKNPNLPQSRVDTVVISETAHEAIRSLKKLNIKTFLIPSDKRLPAPVSSHADLQLLHIGGNKLFIQNEHLCRGELKEKFEISGISVNPGNKYPDDVNLNCAIIGNKIICNKSTIAHEILEFAEIHNLTVINVNQGYTKCSVCVINEKSIITDDKSIFTATQNFFDDVLLISKNSILLKGYNYGFIGGCCGKIDKDKLAINGSIESHTDHNEIIDFLDRNHIECIELTKDRLTDIGGILPLIEL